MTEEKRKEKFEEGLQKLMEKYHFSMYAINAVAQDGEVIPVIKVRDEEEKIETK